MRIAICALSAVMLSGCSWLGGVNNVFGGQGAKGHQAGQYAHAGAVKYGQNARAAHQGLRGQQYGQNFGGGFPQQPQFGAPQQVTGQYGTHAANAHQAHGSQRVSSQMRKPRLRGTFSMGFEKSNSGELLSGESNGFADLSQYVFEQDSGYSGSPPEGLTIESNLATVPTSVRTPSISFDDVHSTPFRIAAGAEFMMSPRTTLFAEAGYSSAEGNEGGSIAIIGEVHGNVVFKGYRDNAVVGETDVDREVENLPIAQLSADFSDLKRLDFVVGGRHYLNPILRSTSARAITPFVGGSVGAAHYNGLSYKAERQNLDLHQAVAAEETSNEYIRNLNDDDPVQIFDSQWVPTGQLNAGLEWQATPKMAVAFETGVKFEGARTYVDTQDEDGNTIAGLKGDNNISVPFTIRGSYNF